MPWFAYFSSSRKATPPAIIFVLFCFKLEPLKAQHAGLQGPSVIPGPVQPYCVHHGDF